MAQFFDAALVAVAEELGFEESGDARPRHLDADQPGAERDDIGVVVLPRETRRERLGDERAARGGIAVDRDRDADPRSAQRHADLGVGLLDRAAEAVAI